MATQRERSIDFFRGLAALNVIAIHTVFHSGSAYTPYWFRQIFLLWDVGVFFFLAGWSASFSDSIIKNLQGIKKFWLDWGLFTICIALAEIIVGKQSFLSLYDLGKAIFKFSFPSANFRSIAYSTWFSPVYIWVAFIFGTLLKCGARYLSEEKHKEWMRLLVAGLLLVFMSCHFLEGDWVDFVRNVLAYGTIYVIGYYNKNVEIDGRKLILGIAVLLLVWGFSSRMFDIPFYDLQSAKFPVSIMYLAASGLSLMMIVFLKHRIPEHWMNRSVCHVGQNAICYYFAQGVGGSLLFKVAPLIDLKWWMKAVVCFAINLVVTIIVAEGFRLFKAGVHCIGCRIRKLENS